MHSNTRVIGAFVIGFALVAGSYVSTHFGATGAVPAGNIYAVATKAEAQSYIPVTDKNSDGVEDWQEEFVSDTPLIINQKSATSSTYKTPESLTDQMGIQLFQSIIEAKSRGNIGPDKTKIIAETADIVKKTAIKDVIYSRTDITVIPSSGEAIRTYGNTIASILINNNVHGSEKELDTARRALDTHSQTELNKLDPLIAMYKNMRDQTLATPVPQGFEKQHLDLINVYQAIFAGISDMKLIFTDPVVSLLRIKRYPDDARGLGNALTNMYTALRPYANLLQPNDPALIFLTFAPKQ